MPAESAICPPNQGQQVDPSEKAQSGHLLNFQSLSAEELNGGENELFTGLDVSRGRSRYGLVGGAGDASRGAEGNMRR